MATDKSAECRGAGADVEILGEAPPAPRSPDGSLTGVEMVDRDPVELGVEVALHLADEVADERFQAGEAGAVLGRDDEAELVRVVARAAEQVGRIDIVVRRIVEIAGLALAWCRRAGCTSGAPVAAKLLDRSEASLARHLDAMLARDALLVSDGAKAYGALARRLGLGHVGLNISAGERVRDGVYHIQNVNSWTSGLKLWMRRFKGAATKNLPVYLGWRRLIESERAALTDRAFVAAAVATASP